MDVGVLDLLVSRVYYPFIIPKTANSHSTCDMDDWDIRDCQGCRSSKHRENAGIMIWIRREHEGNNLSLITKACREQWPQRAVNHAAGDDFLVRWTCLTLDIAAGKSTCRVGVLAVIDGEREKVDSFTRGGGGSRRYEYLCVFTTNNNGSASLFCQSSRFKADSFFA